MLPDTNRLREWRQRRGLTLQQVAEAVGTTKSQIDKLEKGARRLTVDWMGRLAKPLGVKPLDLLPAHFAAFDSVSFPDTLPVKRLADVTKDADIFTALPIDETSRPPALARVPDAYALYVLADDMYPMFRAGQTLYIHPHKPPTPGNGVVVFFKDGTSSLCGLVKLRSKIVTLETFGHKAAQMEIPLTKIKAMHAVVGLWEA